jgi:non-heme chloroperoxidase
MIAPPRPALAPQGQMIPGPLSTQLYVERAGDPQHPTLLFTHGGLQSSRSFRKQVPALSRTFQVITWDLPYHGLSGPGEEPVGTAPLSPLFWAEALRAVIESCDLLHRGFVHIAWSFGGMVTRNYLLRYGPEGLLGQVLVGAPLDLSDRWQRALPRLVQDLMARLFDDDLVALLRLQDCLVARRAAPEEYYETLGYNVLAWMRLRRFGPRLLQAQLPGDLAALVECLPFPVLVLSGEHDVFLPPALAHQLAADIPGAHLICYERCGHSPFLEEPHRFNRDITTFAERAQPHELAI